MKHSVYRTVSREPRWASHCVLYKATVYVLTWGEAIQDTVSCPCWRLWGTRR